jgi:molybdopterin-guanine dinucleotide biosynthesis protein A
MAILISGDQITALVIAGGRGARMGGLDKGLQPFHGQPLVRTVLDRLAAQTLRPARIAINANRNIERYAAIGTMFGAAVWSDDMAAQTSSIEFFGPLAGMLVGLQRATTPYMLTMPCDAPLLPLSLCERLAQALQDNPAADMAVANGPGEAEAPAQLQPLFTLLRRDAYGRLAHDLSGWLDAGERQARAWIARQRHVTTHFAASVETPCPFANANTLEQLRRLESR